MWIWVFKLLVVTCKEYELINGTAYKNWTYFCTHKIERIYVESTLLSSGIRDQQGFMSFLLLYTYFITRRYIPHFDLDYSITSSFDSDRLKHSHFTGVRPGKCNKPVLQSMTAFCFTSQSIPSMIGYASLALFARYISILHKLLSTVRYIRSCVYFCCDYMSTWQFYFSATIAFSVFPVYSDEHNSSLQDLPVKSFLDLELGTGHSVEFGFVFNTLVFSCRPEARSLCLRPRNLNAGSCEHGNTNVTLSRTRSSGTRITWSRSIGSRSSRLVSFLPWHQHRNRTNSRILACSYLYLLQHTDHLRPVTKI
ncbi:hypothetical protein Pelo_1465, partial [Pelomyxa schiedti]